MIGPIPGSVWKTAAAFLTVLSSPSILPPAAVAETFCEILRPNANINELWEAHDYRLIADQVIAPGTPTEDAVHADRSDDDEEQIWGFPNLSTPDIASVTAVHVNIHADGGHLSGHEPEIRIRVGRIWQQVQTAPLEENWTLLSFYGAWSKKDLDDLQLGINSGKMNATEDLVLDAAYCSVCGIVKASTP